MRGWRRKGLLTAATTMAFALLVPAVASAVVTSGPNGRIGYQPLNGQGPSALGLDSIGNLDYHGGPVMHSNTEYAIFWAPTGFSFPAGYKTAMTTYLQDVAADTGKSTNVYSPGTQYTDTTSSRAAYDTTYGGSFDDTTAYPTAAARKCDAYSGFGGSFTTCISDQGLSDEVDAFVTAHSLPRGLDTEYFVFLPPDVGSCFESGAAADCFDREFCAYHSFNNTGGTTLYANESYAAVDPAGCGTGEYPNGHSNGNADDTFSGLSHEANETITDPQLNAWWNSNNGMENGDQCRNTSDDYGPPLGGSPGTLFNQVINGHHYYLQQEWSNSLNIKTGSLGNGCEQRNSMPTPSFTAPATGSVGQSIGFNGTGSSDPDGTITNYHWDFGDGTSGTGATPTHAYSAPGTYHVSLTVTDNNGFESATAVTHDITISSATNHTLTVSVGGSGSGTVTGPGISCPGDCSQSYPNGTSVTLSASAGSGSSFAGFGGDCSGGSCSLTMDQDHTVSATFNANPPPNHTLTVSAGGSGSGTVTGPGISCPGDCSQSYPNGTSVTLSAGAGAGSSFAGFGGACSGGSCSLTMNADQSVSATFNANPPPPKAPDTVLKKAKVDKAKGKALFKFKAAGDATGFQCQLKRKGHKAPKFKSCTSPKRYKHLKPGKYTFSVRAVGPGGTDSSPAKKKFKIPS